MVSSIDLVAYISKLRASGIGDANIKAQLIKAGWLEAEIEKAQTSITAAVTNIPPPPVPHFSLWVSFQYVLLFVTLWIWSIALGGIWHYAINKHIPENVALSQYNYFSMFNNTLLQGYLAAIVVAYPFFVVFFIMLKNQIEKNPGIRNIKTRKVLIYLTMIANFIYMVTQLIKTVFGFLSANSSTRLFPHLLVNLIIPGLICLYLLIEVREDRKSLS